MERQEQRYRQLDAQYRIYEKLFQIEHALHKQLATQFTALRMQTHTTMGALVAVFFMVVPILVSTMGISWGSSSAIAVYLVCASLLILWGWRVREARKTQAEIGLKESEFEPGPLSDWHKYHLDIIAVYGNRLRQLERVRSELDERLKVVPDTEGKGIEDSIARHQEIVEYCQTRITNAVSKSEELLAKGRITSEQHGRVRKWAEPFIDR